MTRQPTKSTNVRFDSGVPAVVIEHLVVSDIEVVTESRHWSTGRRDRVVTAHEMGQADLSTFVHEALSVGARAIASAGSAQETIELERLVADVGTRTVESSTRASEVTSKAVNGAVESMTRAANEARRLLLESEEISRREFAAHVDLSTQGLRDEVERLFGGENCELLTKLRPVLDAAGQKMGQLAFEQTDRLLDKVSRQFDPADPTSPFAKQAATLASQQQALTAYMEKNHQELAGRIEQLARAVEVQKGAARAVEKTASVTPLKGKAYETAANAMISSIAAGLGEEYLETGSTVGALPNCKKGDGLLTVQGGAARIVIEMHDSGDRRAWGEYLDEAERNRRAIASIGLVPVPDQNAGESVRVLGARRVILAFDPASEADHELLRSVVQLVRAAALAASSRRSLENLDTAEEQISKAIQLIDRINAIRRVAASIRKGADTVEKECNTVQTGVQTHLNEALDALSGVDLATGDLGPSGRTSATQGAA